MPEHTPDGRYILVNGRRWRATDPEIPDDVRDRLQKHLMAARRVQDRARVQAAKVALGERGEPWWEQTSAQRRARWERGLAELDQPTG
ncbi:MULTISPECIES: hypothetical protein [unclassified Amycolatopsis]|uniref:hypothetical protein n=1 Tax=unclassified Amycolatopsis TaxID=2618356 RepID=UPI00287554EE|nr:MULTISPECIES: hypothetical protein [unclassified Amycolatopsis]MDS0135611.1 hypothetical protein [Amycolatopsis sp. 505]MDS0148373.1 hypothetical protein [Amycolatopsis sp. CM201R]